jgi:uncharacterized membrane protein YeaQ/YmgE (transglycosylase-associated protein family)
MINFIVWLIVGGLIGWVASMIMRTDAQQGVFLNVIVGIIGAALGGWFISPLGAVVLLAIVNLVRRGSAR